MNYILSTFNQSHTTHSYDYDMHKYFVSCYVHNIFLFFILVHLRNNTYQYKFIYNCEILNLNLDKKFNLKILKFIS